MKNKRNLWLLLLLVLLAGITYYLVKKETAPDSIKFPDRDFAVPDTQNVYRIFLADKEGNILNLERKDKGWLINNQYEGFDYTVNVLLTTIAGVRVKYIPPKAAEDPIIRDLAANGIKVEIFGKDNKKLKTYYVGGNTSDDMGTPFIMDGYEQVYVMQLPGLIGGLRSRYAIKEKDLISRWLFRETEDDITEVTLNYPTQRNNSFRLSRDGKSFTVEPFYPITPVIKGEVNQASVESYLYSFKRIGAEGIIQDEIEKDSVLRMIPFVEIEVKRKDGSKMDVKLFPIFDMILEEEDKFENPQEEWFVERYYAYSDETGLLYLVQHLLFSPILWGYPYFFDQASLQSPLVN
jgi:hypothetical protein